jgi:hypothetical protein
VTDVAAVTKLSPCVLVAIETGEFGALPAGLQGRAHVRAYARAVGLDPDEVLRGLAERLPAEPDPLASLRARDRRRFAEAHPAAAAVRDRAAGWGRSARRLAAGARPAARPAGPWAYVIAGGADAAILGLAGGAMLVGTGEATGAGAAGVWRDAPWPFVASCALMAVLYVAVSRRVGGRTPGAAIAAWLSGSRPAGDPAMLPGPFNGSR